MRGLGPGSGNQHIADCPAGGVRHVHHAPLAVAAFPGQVVGRRGSAAIGAREAHTLSAQPVHAGRSPLGDHAHDCRMTQAGARIDGIAHMGINGILGAQDRGHAALGIVGVAFRKADLVDDRDVHVVGQAQGQTQAGDAAADNENIAGVLVGHGGSVVWQAGGGFAM